MADVIEQVKVKAGRLLTVWNTLKKRNEKLGYKAVWVEDADGSNERCLLFTEKEIARAEARAKKNPEDIPAKSIITDLLD